MNPTLYNAVMEGKLDVLCQYTDDQLHAEATHNRNTVLHVAAQFGHLPCVEKILEACPSLLTFVNVKGETPLHIAAREGYSEIVRTIIESAKKLEQDSESGRGATTKEILRATNVDKDAALHMAVRNCHFEVNKYLEVVILLTKEDVDFEYPANDAKETPLYLAAEQGEQGVDVLSTLLLSTCKSSAYGPGGRTALHMATLQDFTGQSTRKLLDWKVDLINEADPYGWTPLHYATYIGNVAAIGELLETENSAAYIAKADKEDGNTAFHIAAAHGNVDVMRMLLSYSPDCWEIVNFKGQNVLHMAVDTGYREGTGD
ncbi:protein ACCELERATED CELL DEATH 6-like [Rhododendron vialii]|uniref:protein ACCELERATED CELL DEATH 6-like n=1 Tax=Rhododendron vialii TaxID=182163 RepID=UPI00265EBF18|nr:protein ACCELERATED CELL DEATH 6-like [Rhododendron vialii]